MLKKLLLLSLVTLPLFGELIIVHPAAVQHKGKDKIALCFYEEAKKFYVANFTTQEVVEIDMIFSDKAIREFKTQKAIDLYIKADGKFVIKETSRGFILQSHIPLRGGGPIFGTIVFFGVNVLGMAGLMTTAVVANTIAPGAGGLAVTIAVGGNIPATLASIELAAAKACWWAYLLPTP